MPELKTGVGIWSSRHLNPKVSAQFAQILEADPHIDQLVVWDQLMNWFPQALWEPANTPLAAMFDDVDSIADPFLITAFALSAVEKLGFAICCDALRREPAEMAQSLLTLAMATEGQGSLFLGAGEVRHISPFGRRRSIGLKRLEDAFQVMWLLLKETGPVDHDGTVWKMKDAFIGNGGKDRLPR
jgi:phthiodiolone/phenolphthiodiolone dimycocerosates ketoreductase